MLIQILIPYVEIIDGSLTPRETGDILDVSLSAAERMIQTGAAVAVQDIPETTEEAPKRTYRRRTS